MARSEAIPATDNRPQKRGLDQYFNADWSVRDDVHPFLSEVAHLATHRGITQDELANLYNKAAGTRHQGGNVAGHFNKRPDHFSIDQKVIRNYRKALNISAQYAHLLFALRDKRDVLVPSKPRSRDDLKRFIESYLQPELIRPLFQADGLSNALNKLLNDEGLAIECVNAAALRWQRQMAFRLPISSDVAPRIVALREAVSDQGFEEWEWDASGHHDPWYRTGIREEAIVKWDEVARILKRRCDFDLLAKSRKRLEVETTLVDVFTIVCNWVEWHDWLAIQAQLEAIFSRKGLPIEEMRARLNAHFPFEEWADDNDPVRANYLREQMNAGETLDIK